VDEGLAAWCRRWLGAEPVAVLFRAGYLSEVTGGDLLAPGPDAAGRFASLLAELVRLAPDPAAVPTLRPSPAWAAWDHHHPGLWPPPDDLDVDLDDHPGPAWLDRVAAAVRERLAGGGPHLGRRAPRACVQGRPGALTRSRLRRRARGRRRRSRRSRAGPSA
jgi:hypothetical protein